MQKLKVCGNADPTSTEAEITRPKQGIWRTYDATDGLPGGVECLLQDQHGYLWLGTSVEARTGTGLCWTMRYMISYRIKRDNSGLLILTAA